MGASVPCRLLGRQIVFLCVSLRPDGSADCLRVVVLSCHLWLGRLCSLLSAGPAWHCVFSPVVAVGLMGEIAAMACGVLIVGRLCSFVFVVRQIVFLCVCRRVVALVSRPASFFVFCVASCRFVSRLVVW